MGSRRRQSRSPVARLRLTAAGWAFVVITLVVAAATVKSQSAMLFVIVGAMIGALAASGAMAWRMVRAVSLERDVPAQAWQSQTIHLGYYLRNTRPRPCLALALEEQPVAGIETTSGFCAHLPPRGIFRSGARFVPRRRGRLTLTGVEVLSRFPFGLVSGHCVVPRTASVVVWPARGRLKQRMLHRGAVESSSAPPSQATGGQDEFFGLRDYRSDDNPRWIHWRRSATRQVPVVREMCHPKPEILYVVLDTRLVGASPAAWARRERLIRFAGTLIEHALARGYQVGLALASRGGACAHPAAAGRGQMHLLLTALADVDDTTALPLGATVATLRRSDLAEAQVIVVADSPVETAALRPLRAACRNVSVVTADRLAAVFEDDPLAAGQEVA
jgi:uncharacterized protein (DUF58 family)